MQQFCCLRLSPRPGLPSPFPLGREGVNEIPPLWTELGGGGLTPPKTIYGIHIPTQVFTGQNVGEEVNTENIENVRGVSIPYQKFA